jgi:hypothetical protein
MPWEYKGGFERLARCLSEKVDRRKWIGDDGFPVGGDATGGREEFEGQFPGAG